LIEKNDQQLVEDELITIVSHIFSYKKRSAKNTVIRYEEEK